MNRPRAILLLSALFVSVTPVAAQALPFLPQPVVDVGPIENAYWQITSIKETLDEAHFIVLLKDELLNLLPTAAGWAASTNDPTATEPILDAGEATMTTNIAAVEANTGMPQSPDIATNVAVHEMAVIPTQQADITAAQTASDDAEGDLSAQQAGHRLQELQVTNDMQTRQLLYSQQIQKSADEADAMAWMSEHT